MRNIIFIWCLLIVVSCKTKSIHKVEHQKKTEIKKVEKVSETKEEQKTTLHQEQKSSEVQTQEQEEFTLIDIIAEATIDNPFELEYFESNGNKKNIKVSGNAKINYSSSNKAKDSTISTKQSENSKALQNVAVKIEKEAEKTTIAKKATTDKEKKTKTINVTFPVVFWGCLIIVLIALLIYFGKGGKLVEMFKKFKKERRWY